MTSHTGPRYPEPRDPRPWHPLLFQLMELLKELPTVIDVYDWEERLAERMEEIQQAQPQWYERLVYLVSEAGLLAKNHVAAIDEEASPKVLEQSRLNYFVHLAHLSSEVNALRSDPYPNRNRSKEEVEGF